MTLCSEASITERVDDIRLIASTNRHPLGQAPRLNLVSVGGVHPTSHARSVVVYSFGGGVIQYFVTARPL